MLRVSLVYRARAIFGCLTSQVTSLCSCLSFLLSGWTLTTRKAMAITKVLLLEKQPKKLPIQPPRTVFLNTILFSLDECGCCGWIGLDCSESSIAFMECARLRTKLRTKGKLQWDIQQPRQNPVCCLFSDWRPVKKENFQCSPS